MSKSHLSRARECYRRRAWSEAHRLLLLVEQTTPLDAADLERLATSAYLIGRDLDFQRYLERAHHAHVEEGAPPRAARCAFWIGLTLLLRGETAQANGWLGRASRLVEGRDCVEEGYLLLPAAERHLEERNGEAAFAVASAALDAAHRFGDGDLAACALHLMGRATIQQGEVQRGLGMLDETMVSVSDGALSPILTGLLYCSVIAVCHEVFALTRACEWTIALSRWCDQQPELMAFTGTCLVHRAELMQLRGAWTQAMAEAIRACERVSRASDRRPPATAIYRQGELHRLRGEFRQAEEAYRRASRLGLEPQPGLALLRMAQGRCDAARAAIRRILDLATDPLHRAKLLPAYVEIAVVAGELQEARAAATELGEIARQYATEVLQAMAAYAQAAVELAEGRARDALSTVRRAFELWQRHEAPYETARVRLLIAQACIQLEDVESADLEFEAARALFDELGAAPDLARLDALRERKMPADQCGLTRRELQVLRQVAAGRTNRNIASELCVSERTIDRHVSNIFTKLGVTSRVAATSYAFNHKLI